MVYCVKQAGSGVGMVTVTKFNEREVVVNCELIEQIEATPDTVITMTTGHKIIVKESVE